MPALTMYFLRILQNSAFMALAQSLSIGSQIVRSKIIAATLGAPGIAMLGFMNSYAGNITSISGWGLSTSGVRMMASAENAERPVIASAVACMGRWLSIAAIALAVLTCWPMCKVTFGNGFMFLEFALAGLSAPFLVAGSVFVAMLQVEGDHRSIAIAQSVGAVMGLLLGGLLIFFLGTLGVALAILVAAAIPAFLLWLKARPLLLSHRAAPQRKDILSLARTGGALMLVGWFAQISAYTVRLIIIKETGVESSGYYQAAFSIASTAPLLVLATMANEFFPRIAGVAEEEEARKAAEKQVQATLLIGLPVVAAIICLGRLGLRMLYSQEFEPATPLLSWMGWGAFFRLASWPFGYWLLARGSARQMIAMEFLANFVSVLLTLLLVRFYGLEGAAMSFFWSSLLYVLIMACVVRQRSGGWVAAHVWGAFLMAAAVLAAAQAGTRGPNPYFSGVLPVFIVTALCAAVYWKLIKSAPATE